jgi:uncharacterized protein (TIGR03083 family)
MGLPGVDDLLVERELLIETFESLTDAEFESGPTLCLEWAPRDVLAHVIGLDSSVHRYVLAGFQVDKANAAIVAAGRRQTRPRLMARARHWAARPAPLSRAAAAFLLGDLAVHHQDVVRGLGRTRELPEASAAAILREGVVLGGKRLLTHRVEPTDGGRPLGRGTRVRGTREALGLWLAGRAGIDHELQFGTADE